MITNALARHSLAPPGLVARRAGGARVGRGKFKKPLRRELFATHAASARFFACPQPQPHLRAGGVSTPQTGWAREYLTLGSDGLLQLGGDPGGIAVDRLLVR